MTTTIVRVATNRDHPYVMLDKRLTEDPSLSWKAKGLMAYMLSRPDGWQIRVTDLVRRSDDGEYAVKSGLRELEQRGYLIRKRRHDAATGRFLGVTLTVYEESVPSSSAGAHAECAPATAPPPYDPPQTQAPRTELPRTGYPQVDDPQVENRPLTNTELIKTEKTQIDDDVVPPLPPHDPSCVQAADPILAQVVALYEQEIGGTLTAMIHDELTDLVQNECGDLERWRAAFRLSIGARNRWKYARAIILHPERKPPQEVRRATSQRSGQLGKAHGLSAGRSRRGRANDLRGRDLRGRGGTTPSPEEIERLNREAEEQLLERGDIPGNCR